MTNGIADQILKLLLRNISAPAILNAAFLTIDDTRWTGAQAPMALYIGVDYVPDRLRTALTGELRLALEGIHLDPDHLEWVLAISGLSPSSRAQAAKALSELTVDRVDEDIPHEAPNNTWAVVRGPDVLLDLLSQPLLVVTNLFDQIAQAWSPIAERGLQTFLDNRLPDEITSAIELFMVRSLGISPDRADVTIVDDGVAYRSALPGFQPVEDIGALPWSQNPFGSINPPNPSPRPKSRPGTADPFYGHVFSLDYVERTDVLYQAAHEVNGNYGHLSLPFRAVPRFFCESLEQAIFVMERIVEGMAKFTDEIPLFRGQTQEYRLPRPNGTRTRLFGDEGAIEPSLLPSGTRRQTSDSTFMAFRTLIEMATDVGEVAPPGWSDKSMWSRTAGDSLKTAFAQHYGLATASLDLTESFLTAFWFASTRLDAAGPGEYVARAVDDENECVVYIVRSGGSAGSPIHVTLSPTARPARQKGWVSPTTWGWRSNRAATNIVGALYFPGSVRRELTMMPTVTDLFPSSDSDPVVRLASLIGGRLPESHISEELRRDLYRVAIDDLAER